MRPQPDISVLIPVYNREKYIADCIQSAMNQTYKNIEIVVVDNASTDSTWEICQAISAQDHRVRLFRNDKNIGPVRNWIRCVEKAQGKLSKILFSDDLLEPNCLQEMARVLASPKIGLVYCAAYIGLSKEDSLISYRAPTDTTLAQPEFLERLLNHAAPLSPGAILIRTEDLKRNLHQNFPTAVPRPFSEHGAGPDVMISLLTAKSYPYVASIKNPLVFFRAHTDSFTISNSNNRVTEGYISAIAYYLKNNENKLTWLKYISNAWLNQIRQHKKWNNPILFIRNHEGSGSPIELAIGIIFCFQKIARKTYKSLTSK